MCGIAGIVGINTLIDNNTINKLSSVLNHRGPDFQNFIKDKNLFLFHARLSIIDLNKRSNQPMFCNKKKLLIVFNGEIYNYVELKKELFGYNFKTTSDTEVILAAYERWGRKCLDKFYGAFAFCIYDLSKKTTFFARDRFGQKPFFFLNDKKTFKFSSEIKGLIALGYKPSPNEKIWHDYLVHAKTDESNSTFFKDIFQLLPGECGLLNNKNELKIERWYSLKDKIKFNQNKTINSKLEIKKKLIESISNCSRADVPIAISLSGGLDSSILFSLHNKFNILKTLPKSYSVIFGKDFSEKKFIDLTTGYYKKKSKFVNFSLNDWISSIKPSIYFLESPAGGLMNCALAKINHKIKQDNFKVMQDATGLDEIFGGYEYHHLLYLNELKNTNVDKFEINFHLYLKNWQIKKSTALKKLRELNNQKNKSIDGYDLNSYPIFNKQFLKTYKKKYSNKNNNLKESLIDYVQLSKIPRNNRLKDRISMAFGVELRLPFLEHELIELGLSLDPDSYFMKGRSKAILRESVKNIVEEKVRVQKKFSIQSPQNYWIKEKIFIKYFEEILFSESLASRNFFDIQFLKKIWKNFLENENNETSFFLWQVINLEEWFRVFIDKDSLNTKYKFNFK